MLSSYDLSGRTALITGGAGLLGMQHGLALAEAGAAVVMADLRAEGAETAAAEIRRRFSRDALALLLDVTSLDSIEAARRSLAGKFEHIDILVNNAAIDAKVRTNGDLETSRFENFALEQWNREVAVGLTGAFLCSRVFGSRMAARGRGVILNIASDLSVIAPDQRIYRKGDRPPERQPTKPVTYSVIKTALIGLTRYLAAYWADRGVRVNALSPGGVRTAQPEEFVQRLSQLIPLGRMANAGEYRGAVQFLCSDASSYLTGQNIVADGGRSVL